MNDANLCSVCARPIPPTWTTTVCVVCASDRERRQGDFEDYDVIDPSPAGLNAREVQWPPNLEGAWKWRRDDLGQGIEDEDTRARRIAAAEAAWVKDKASCGKCGHIYGAHGAVGCWAGVEGSNGYCTCRMFMIKPPYNDGAEVKADKVTMLPVERPRRIIGGEI